MTAALGAACLATCAVMVGLRGGPRWRRRATVFRAQGSSDRALLLRVRPALVGFVFVAGWAFVGGPIGVLAGLAGAVLAWRILGRAESPAGRARRVALERDLPLGIDLLESCLSGGAALEATLPLVADAVGGPLQQEFQAIHHRLALGVDPHSVWREISHHPELGPLGRAAVRGHESGASIADAIARLGAELRAEARTEVETRAKSVAVRAAAPLGLCFLPAFMLLGVVPLVVGIFTSLQPFD